MTDQPAAADCQGARVTCEGTTVTVEATSFIGRRTLGARQETPIPDLIAIGLKKPGRIYDGCLALVTAGATIRVPFRRRHRAGVLGVYAHLLAAAPHVLTGEPAEIAAEVTPLDPRTQAALEAASARTLRP